ncbi:MAG: SDR family NAD(P)-dependent oxidoreductase, partial [Nitrospirota bacterium]
MAKVLITGVAGFIGFHLAKRLLAQGNEVAGVDNLNDYYEVSLKEARLAQLQEHGEFRFHKMDLADREGLPRLFKDHPMEIVVNLAAQAGV